MKRILVVGNSFPNNVLTGQEVLTVSSYDEAIKLLKDQQFDVILTDAVIGDDHGHDFLKDFRDQYHLILTHTGTKATIKVNGKERDWFIASSFRLFPGAVFVDRTDDDWVSQVCARVIEGKCSVSAAA